MKEQVQGDTERLINENAEVQLKELFAGMIRDVYLVLFTDSTKKGPFDRAAGQILRALQKIGPKIKIEEHDLGHEHALQWNVTTTPTILFDPERFNIRWLGAPVGEEARTLIEALVIMGYGDTRLSDESQKVLRRLDASRGVKVFVSPTCPYCPQQAVNALRAAFQRPELVSLEIVDIQANPDVAARYGAQSVPQVFANEMLIAQGAQPEELFMASLEKMAQQTFFIPESDAGEIENDLVIVGGGPAGLTAGIYAARSGLKAAVIERGILGGQMATTPVIENYPGLTQVGGKALVDIMVSHALEYTSIFPGEEVMAIEPGLPAIVHTNRRRFKTKAVLLATGAVYRHLDVPGESRLAGHGISYCSTCDGPVFAGKKVIIVGGGNSAVTEALHLRNIGVDVTLVHRRDSLRAQDNLVKSLRDAEIPVLFNTEVREIRGAHEVQEVELFNTANSEISVIKLDGVFIAIGYDPAVQLAEKAGIELTGDGYIKHDDHHRTNVPGIYSAGDVEGGYKQIVIAAAKGSEAALTIFEDLTHPYWQKDE